MKKDKQMEKLVNDTSHIEKDSNICGNCDGFGYTIEIEAICCGNYKDYGCCGIPEPIQVQVECSCDKGFERAKL